MNEAIRSKTATTAMLFLHAQTPLHPGSGTALGVVDLPVQRERHTLWPIVPGSSLKGVLRDTCRQKAGNGDEWLAAFGPETGQAGEHAGALSVTDARLLAFPVRSLRGVFAWATCPAVLERLLRDCRLAAAEPPPLDWLSQLQENHLACTDDSPLLIERENVVLEEFDFRRQHDCSDLARWIAEHAVEDPFTQSRLQSHLVVLHDNDFTHFVRHATEVVARIGLDYERKTVKKGALFYQEFLPAETIFYCLVLANRSRRQGCEKTSEEVLSYLRQHLPPILQIGGDETTGKGICSVKLQ